MIRALTVLKLNGGYINKSVLPEEGIKGTPLRAALSTALAAVVPAEKIRPPSARVAD